MISDPKLPLITGSASLGEMKSAATAPQPSAPPAAVRRSSPSRLWLRRLGVLLFVFFCATVGVMLIMLPWRPEWTENHFLLHSPRLLAIVSSGFVRGLCTGLGFINVWIGFQEALRYHED